jgi:hypothetical protein
MKANWDKITTKQFIEIRDAIATEKNPIIMRCKVVSIASGRSVDSLLELSTAEGRELFDEWGWVFTYPEDLPIKERFKWKGRRFRAVLNAYDISAGQFIDETKLSEGREIDMIRNLNMLLGVLIKEETAWYRKRRHLTNKEKFEMVLDLPISYVYPNVVFFCRVWENLLKHIPTFLEEIAEELTETMRGLSEDGDG